MSCFAGTPEFMAPEMYQFEFRRCMPFGWLEYIKRPASVDVFANCLL